MTSPQNTSADEYRLSPTSKAMYQAGYTADEILAADHRRMARFARYYIEQFLEEP